MRLGKYWSCFFFSFFGCFVLRDARYGEDAGTPRTSTKPKLVDALEGLTVMQVAMGYGHSLLLAK